MKQIARILFGGVNNDFTGANILEKTWNASPGKRSEICAGAIAIPYATPQYHKLMELYRDVSARHPIRLVIHEVETVYSRSDLTKAEILEIEFGVFVELQPLTFETTFDVMELCSSCHRTSLRQKGALQLAISRNPQEDFFSVLEQGARVALIVSRRARDILEDNHVNAQYAEVLNAEGVPLDVYQLCVRDIVAVSDRSRRVYGPRCESCGECEGIYLPESAKKPEDEAIHVRREEWGGKPFFLAGQYGGKGKWLNDSNRWKLMTSELFRRMDSERLRGLGWTMACVD